MNKKNLEEIETSYLKIVYNMMKTKLFMPVGLELNCTSVFFETNDTFVLKDVTFAYYNPIDNSIHINIENKFFKECENELERDSKLFFIIFHEAMHKILMHQPQRGKNKNTEVWNMASDYEIHNLYYVFSQSIKNENENIDNVSVVEYLKIIDKFLINVPEKERTFLFSSKFIDKIAEEIYCILENSKEIKRQTFKIPFFSFMKNQENKNSSNENNDSNGNENNDSNGNSNGNSNENSNGNENNDPNGNSNGNENNDSNGNSNRNSNENSNKNSNGNENGLKQNNQNKQNKEIESLNKNLSTSKNNSGNNSGNNSINSGKRVSNINGANSKNYNDNSSELEVSITQTTYKLPDGKTHTVTDIKWPENNELPEKFKKNESQIERETQNHTLNKSLMENNFCEFLKKKGNISEECQKFLKKLFHIKIDWEKILRNSLQTILEKSDYFAWNKIRTSSFLLPNMPYLPDIIDDEEKYGTLIISRDESGSMTDEAISKAGKIILDAKEFYKKIVVIKHDEKILKVYEFEEINDDVIKCLCYREVCGGTSHKEVFEFLRDYKKNHSGEDISCYIGISDLISDIEITQDIIPSNIPIVWLAPVGNESYFNNIKGKIIPIEL